MSTKLFMDCILFGMVLALPLFFFGGMFIAYAIERAMNAYDARKRRVKRRHKVNH